MSVITIDYGVDLLTEDQDQVASLLELSRRELLDKTRKQQPIVRKRSGVLVSEYMAFRKGSQILFRTTSATTPGVDYWYQTISIKLPKVVKSPAWRVLVKSLRGQLRVRCTCPAFKWWGYWYILGELDSLFGHKTPKFPKIRNPKLKGALCKHLYSVLTVLPANMPEITRDVKKKFKIK